MKEITGKKRGRTFAYSQYPSILVKGMELLQGKIAIHFPGVFQEINPLKNTVEAPVILNCFSGDEEEAVNFAA